MRIIAVDDEELALERLMTAIQQAAPEAELHGFFYPEDALAFLQNNGCDVAFLDVEMADISGVELARKLKEKNPDVNIIFATGFSRYREAAFDLHASGYLTKPITTDKVRKELAELRRPVAKAKRMRVQTFGNFEVYVDGRPLEFRYSRTKEMLAYLVDRQGALCTVGGVQAVLFEDETGHESYMKSLRQDLQVTLDEAGCGGVLVKQWGKLAVQTSAFDCDYYDWREGRREGISYQGEYMSQYSWGEETNALLAGDEHSRGKAAEKEALNQT